MTEISKLIPVLAKILGQDESAVKELLLTESDEGETLAEGFAENLTNRWKERAKEVRKQGVTEYERKNANARTEAEEAHKAELEALRAELEQAKAAGAGAAETNAERLKREAAHEKALADLKAAHEAERQGWEGKYKREQTKARAIKRGMEYFDGLRPILDEEPAIAIQQRKDFERWLSESDFDEPDEDKFVLLRDGKPGEDEDYNLLTLEKHVESLARPRYRFQKQEAKGNAGNQTQKPGGSTGLPKTEEEFIRQRAELSTPQERADFTDRWNAAQQNKSN